MNWPAKLSDGLTAAETARINGDLATLGGMTPVDPGADHFGRGTSNPFIFSNALDVPNLSFPPPAPPFPAVPLLTVQGKDGVCRRWSVQVLCSPVAGTVAIAASVLDALRLRLTMGAGTVSVDVDVPGGSAAFECYAQAVDLAYVNADTVFTGGPSKRVLAVVSPVLGGQASFPGMFPTRTVLYAVPAIVGAPIVLPIPKFAQAVQFSAPPAALDFGTEWQNTYGAGIALGRTSVLWQQVPNGSGALAITSNPTGAPATVAAVYRLAL